MSGNVTVKGLEQVMGKFDKLANFRLWARDPLKELQEEVYQETQKYPKKSGTFSQTATPGQKRAYWAKVRSGEARHGANGYIRSNGTKAAWKKPALRVIANGLQAEVSNNVSHGVYVHGNQQQRFHTDSGFKTEQQLADSVEADGVFKAAIDAVLNS
jgi:hypothetical protein